MLTASIIRAMNRPLAESWFKTQVRFGQRNECNIPLRFYSHSNENLNVIFVFHRNLFGNSDQTVPLYKGRSVMCGCACLDRYVISSGREFTLTTAM
jgi:hypothetical protein